VGCLGPFISSMTAAKASFTPRENGAYLSERNGEICIVVGASLLANAGVRESPNGISFGAQVRSYQTGQGPAAGRFFLLK